MKNFLKKKTILFLIFVSRFDHYEISIYIRFNLNYIKYLNILRIIVNYSILPFFL